jgi:hypothetical protein
MRDRCTEFHGVEGSYYEIVQHLEPYMHVIFDIDLHVTQRDREVTQTSRKALGNVHWQRDGSLEIN